MRSSLSSLYDDIRVLGDVVVVVQADMKEWSGDEARQQIREFPAVSALLASTSRPLHQMLYGAMRSATPSSGDQRPRLVLRDTDPWCFEQMLHFIHGKQICAPPRRPPPPAPPPPPPFPLASSPLAPSPSAAIDQETALQLHHVADYYEVLRLKEACTNFLLEAVRPSNCCALWARGEAVHCPELTQRCMDMLTLDFTEVAEHDPCFAELPAAVLKDVLERDELVCGEEYEVYEALVAWYKKAPTAEKHASLLELLPLVRWARVGEERRADVFEEADEMAPPHPLLDGAAEEEPNKDVSTPAARRKKAGASADADDEDNASDEERPVGRGRPGRNTARDLVRELWPQPAPGAPNIDGGASSTAAAKEAEDEEVAGAAGPRQYTWGTLSSHNPDPHHAGPAGDQRGVWRLASTRDYMVGRSRKSDIRIGHTAPMPYISSQHFRVYHTIRWPAAGADAEAPRLQPWLEDLSQNGTYVNGRLVGKHKTVELQEADRIELVFPQGRVPPSNMGQNGFPIFTFGEPKNPEDKPPEPVAAGDESEEA